MFEIQQTKANAHSRRIRMAEINITPDGKPLAHPAPRAPRIFADTAAYEEIEPLYRAGIINGVTTNPTLMKRAGAANWDDVETISKRICELLHPNPVSLELTEVSQDKMIEQAEHLGSWAENVIIKVPIGGYQALDPNLDPYTGLKVIRALWERNIKTNCTLIFNSTQALWAANAGATYVSPFLGRMADYARKNDSADRTVGNSLYWVEEQPTAPEDQRVLNTEYVASGGARKDTGSRLINEIAVVFTNYDIHTEILAASFRNAAQVTECLLAGADILTVPAPILAKVADHALTDEGMIRFVEDSKVFDTQSASA